jgi:hypothetical protein
VDLQRSPVVTEEIALQDPGFDRVAVDGPAEGHCRPGAFHADPEATRGVGVEVAAQQC